VVTRKGELFFFQTPAEKAAMSPLHRPVKLYDAQRPAAAISAASAPTTYKDWTTTGLVPPVRDQVFVLGHSFYVQNVITCLEFREPVVAAGRSRQ